MTLDHRARSRPSSSSAAVAIVLIKSTVACDSERAPIFLRAMLFLATSTPHHFIASEFMIIDSLNFANAEEAINLPSRMVNAFGPAGTALFLGNYILPGRDRYSLQPNP